MSHKPATQATKTDKKTLKITKPADKSTDEVLAAMAYDPLFRSLSTTKACGSTAGEIDLAASMTVLKNEITRVNTGDLSNVERTLVVQANTLDALFNALACRALASQQYSGCECYLRLALKTQQQCRTTLKTLADIKAPPTVIARQANITTGPQQVNNHLHTGEGSPDKSKSAKQTIGIDHG